MGRVIPVDPEDEADHPIQYRLTEAAHRALLVAMWEERIMAGRIEFTTALGAAEGVATRTGNYFRALKNGGKHDPHEVAAILEDIQILQELTREEVQEQEA